MDDLRLTGGRLLDPARGLDGTGDIAIDGGRIRAAGDVPPAPAREVVDATGLLVTPGLIDLHTHLHGGGTFWGLQPDPVAWYTGVTTWVDAGSAGAYTLGPLLAARRGFAVHSAVFLHIAGQGLAARTGESRDLADLDVDSAVDAAVAHSEAIRGIKVRIDGHTVGGNGLEPLRRALAAAESVGVPVMVHIADGPFKLDEVIDLLRPGDIVTHCAGRGAAGILQPGAVRDAIHAGYERGVVFDIGHGVGGFSFEVAESYLAQELPPKVISTDLHALCASGPAFDLPTVMAKLLAVGMSLADVVTATTSAPAAAAGLPAGTLAPGAPADIAVFRVLDGPVLLGDAHGVTRTGTTVLRNAATYVAGRRLKPAFPGNPPSWVALSPGQRAALARREEQLRAMLSEPLVPPEQLQYQMPPTRAEATAE